MWGKSASNRNGIELAQENNNVPLTYPKRCQACAQSTMSLQRWLALHRFLHMERTLLWLMGMLLISSLQADDPDAYWPQWRGPLWNGVAPVGNPPVEWSESRNLIWKTPIEGQGWSTPIIWENHIFLHTAIPMEKKLPIPDVIPPGTPNIGEHPDVASTWKAQRIGIICINRSTGKELWRRFIFEGMPHQGHHRKGGFASQSPVTDGKYLYSYFGSFGLYCFDFDGNLIWEKPFKPQAMEDSLGEGTSPALHDDHLIIVADQEQQSYIVAIDKHTGKEIRKTKREEVSNWSTPRIFTHENRTQILVNGAPVICYDFETGEALWQCAGQSLSAVPMPAVGQGLAFAASGWRKDTVHAIRLGQRGDLTDTEHLVWKLDRGAPYVPCPMVWEEEIYLLEDHSFFSCLRAIDGKQYYLKHRLPSPANFSASPVGAKDRIYLLSEEGRTFVMKKGPEPTILAINELEGRFQASPAIVEHRIYIRSSEHLYCFGKD